jgi:endo-1,4-beta-D-glucanase Y
MDWRLEADGSSSDAAGGGWNAMDGDLDIAMALLMADRQWGSTGAWNYKQEGINTINAMKAFNMKPDGTTKGLATPT